MLLRQVFSVFLLIAAVLHCKASLALPPPTTWSGYVIANNQIQLMPDAVVAQWLPPGLELAPAPGYAGGQRPIVVVFQKQMNSLVNGTESVADYLEQAIIVPFVRVAGRHTTYNYMPRLFLNSPRAIKVGLQAWGLPKLPATLSVTSDGTKENWSVSDAAGRLVASQFVATSSPMDVNTFLGAHPDFLSDLPIFGPNYVSVGTDGPMCFEIAFDLLQAQFQVIHATVTTSRAYLPAQPTNKVASLGIDPNTAQDSFRVQGPFMITPAHTCQ